MGYLLTRFGSRGRSLRLLLHFLLAKDTLQAGCFVSAAAVLFLLEFLQSLGFIVDVLGLAVAVGIELTSRLPVGVFEAFSKYEVRPPKRLVARLEMP
ncbi:hypothetical protein RRF57_011099 [Xylaria bambusicola]|uniref:Uncharacterized protein n=1 Tax=Xylaria bambusicola TaxID=326684 RepID=A0AAN7Z9E2_9PEZI